MIIVPNPDNESFEDTLVHELFHIFPEKENQNNDGKYLQPEASAVFFQDLALSLTSQSLSPKTENEIGNDIVNLVKWLAENYPYETNAKFFTVVNESQQINQARYYLCLHLKDYRNPSSNLIDRYKYGKYYRLDASFLRALIKANSENWNKYSTQDQDKLIQLANKALTEGYISADFFALTPLAQIKQ